MELDCGFSRSAVLGKAWRIGLAKKERIAAPRPRIYKKRETKPRIAKAKRIEIKEEENCPELLVIPVEQRKTLMQLTDQTCHWPVGDPGSGDFYFCGGITRLRNRTAHIIVVLRTFLPRERNAAELAG